MRLPHVLQKVDSLGEPPQAKFPSLFTGLGELKGDPYEIQLKSDAACNVPLPLREKVQTELQCMQAVDVIAPVEEPTPWCSGMVVVPKKSGQVPWPWRRFTAAIKAWENYNSGYRQLCGGPGSPSSWSRWLSTAQSAQSWACLLASYCCLLPCWGTHERRLPLTFLSWRASPIYWSLTIFQGTLKFNHSLPLHQPTSSEA